ncbi:T23E23.4 [Arabidopsis thaliana]|uniref:T23E23.4 n=1 Tax=Arabidopsis thaliana TaxID=3702 RepID=Q9LRA6_ARATH|nr:T23E23.4 [Arabidopsis thaliana]
MGTGLCDFIYFQKLGRNRSFLLSLYRKSLVVCNLHGVTEWIKVGFVIL